MEEDKEIPTNMDETSRSHEHTRKGDTLKKVIHTVFLALCWICLGLMMEVSGPTLIDLKARTKSSYEAIATAIAGRNVGYLIGALFGGVLVDKFGLYCDLMVALSLELCALATIGIPWIPRAELILVLCCFQGIGGGVLNTSGMKLVFNMWQEKAASPMHVLHGGYGIGGFIIPLIANPFLAVPAPKNDYHMEYNVTGSSQENTTLIGSSETTTVASKEIQYLKESRIEFAYLIPALITICLSSVFHVYYFMGKKERKQREKSSITLVPAKRPLKFKQMLNPSTCTGGDTIYGLEVFALLFLFYFNCVGGERIGGTFIRAYSIDHFGFSVDDGSYINTTFALSFAVGRYVGFLAARWIPIRILILIESGGFLLSTICHATLSGRSAIALWIIIQPIGFFTGPLFPSGMGWGNHHVTMTGTAIAVFQLGACIGAFVYLKVIGFLYDKYGTETFLYSLLVSGIAIFVNSVLLNAAAIHHSKHSTRNKEEKAEESMEVIKQTEAYEDESFKKNHSRQIQ